MKSMYLLLTPDCNLRCRYCFQRDSRPDRPDRETTGCEQPRQGTVHASPETIDAFVAYCAREGIEHVELFGGEPLYYADLLHSTVEKLCDSIPSITIGIVTNGTLLSDRIMTLCETRPVSILLSLDGDRDRHNHFRGGFDHIAKWIPRLARQGRVGVAMQAGMIQGLHRNLEWIWSQGLANVYINIIETYGWYSAPELATFESEYELAIRGMLENRGKLTCALQLHGLLQQPVYNQGCGITGHGLACDWLGQLYPCQRAMEPETDLSVGNIFDGIDNARAQRIRATIHAQAFESDSARKNPVASFCPVAVYQENRDFAGAWNAEYCNLIHVKARFVSKYYHEISMIQEHADPDTTSVLNRFHHSPASA